MAALSVACADPKAPVSPPASAPITVLTVPPPTAKPMGEAPPAATKQVFFPVLSTVDTEIEVLPFPGGAGATVIARSFLAVVRGDVAVQDPAWLTGLPQSINTDGIRLHRTRMLAAPGSAEPFPDDFQVGTVKTEATSPAGAYVWGAGRGFRPAPAAGKPKAIAGVPTALDGTGEHWFPASEGGVFIVRTYGPRLTVFRVDAQEKLRSTETFPLPEGVSDVSVLRFSGAEILAQGGRGGVFTLKDGTLTPLTGPQSLPIARAALTDDGTLWVLTGALPKTPAAIHARGPDGAWSRKDLPDGLVPRKIWASGSRVWLTTSGAAGAGQQLWSNEPIKTALTLGAAETPWATAGGTIPVLSDAPAGPGSAACAKPVVWLGETADPAVVAAASTDEKAKRVPLVLAAGKPALLAPRAKSASPAPKQAASSLVLVATSFADAMAISASLAPALAKLGAKAVVPRVLCAVVKEKKKISAGSGGP